MAFIGRTAGRVFGEVLALLGDLTEALSQPPVLAALVLLVILLGIRLALGAQGGA